MESRDLRNSSARLEQIWIKRSNGGPMDPVKNAELLENRGIVDNANQGGRRQVTLIEAEIWSDVCRILGADIPPETRRANLMISGLSLYNTRHRILLIGECQLEILGETKPCRLMDEFFPGLKAELYPKWRGGAFARVLKGGKIKLGDLIMWQKSIK